MSQSIDISIISSGANLADARLHRLTRALLRAGLAVEIFAPGDVKDAPAAIIRNPLLGDSWRNTSLLARYYRSRIFVLRSRGRVIYAISPESVAPAFGLAKLLRKKFAVDFFEARGLGSILESSVGLPAAIQNLLSGLQSALTSQRLLMCRFRHLMPAIG